jgi:microcompartment protein CcmK/EutM
VDSVQAGVGDLVHWITAREAALTLSDTFVAVDAAITGVVYQVNPECNEIKDKQEIFG